MATLSVGLVIVFLGLPLLLLADTMGSIDGGGGGGGGCGSPNDSDCDGYDRWGTGGFNDPYEQDLDDHDSSIGTI